MEIIYPGIVYAKPLIPINPDKFQFIIIHHAATNKCTVWEIDAWHKKKGDKGLGYCEFINKDGVVYIGRGDSEGAHTLGYNSNGYGICLEGNFDEKLPTPAQLQSLVERLKYHAKRFKNLKSIVGHRDVCNTSCPGKNFKLESIIKEVYDVSEMTDASKALDILLEAKIITNKEYWAKTLDTVYWQKELFLNVANLLRENLT